MVGVGFSEIPKSLDFTGFIDPHYTCSQPEGRKFESSSRNQHCEPKKISVRKTRKPQRFLGFFLPFFKVQFKRYHFPKTTFGEDLN